MGNKKNLYVHIGVPQFDVVRKIHGQVVSTLYKCRLFMDNTVVLGTTPKNGQKKGVLAAQRRWGLLARTLKDRANSSAPVSPIVPQHISAFELIKIEPVFLTVSSDHRNWYRYSIDNVYDLVISHRQRTFSAEDLMGFNNTGNVCIWPSEETLAYYICANLSRFYQKTVLELGGGMSCLAGLFAAKYGQCQRVVVTDGNRQAIDNVKISIPQNQFPSEIDVKQLKWSTSTRQQFDIILCADCLFFDDVRDDLINCLWMSLASKGRIFIMAPKRRNTLELFLAKAVEKGFQYVQIENYNETIWRQRSQLLLSNSSDYDDDIHYPILVEMYHHH